jgi:hypothetical protein
VIEHRISTEDMAGAAADLAGFDRAGIVALMSRVWRFDPEAPPDTVPIRARLGLVGW